MVLRDAAGLVADSLNYGGSSTRGSPRATRARREPGRAAATPPLTAGAGKSASRHPDGTDTDSNCIDFIVTNDPTPGAANQGLALDPGPGSRCRRRRPAARRTTSSTTTPMTSWSPRRSRPAARPPTSRTRPSSRRPGWPTRAASRSSRSTSPATTCGTRTSSSTCSRTTAAPCSRMDATFCPQAGNSGQGTSFQSVNFPGRYIRQFNSRRLPRQRWPARDQPLGHRYRLDGRHELAGGHAMDTGIGQHFAFAARAPPGTPSSASGAIADLARQYADFPLATADASVIAAAERLSATHGFRAVVRPCRSRCRSAGCGTARP